MKIKRYDTNMEEKDDGEYIKYEDVKHLIFKCKLCEDTGYINIGMQKGNVIKQKCPNCQKD